MRLRLLQSLPVRPRTALALGLLIVVAVIIVIGNLIGGPTRPTFSPDDSIRPSTVDASVGNDSVANPQPTTLPSDDYQQVLAVANAFAASWVDHKRSAKAWRDSLLPHSTTALAAELSGVDPAGVPANRITGAAVVEVHSPGAVDVIIPIDAGRLRLKLVSQQSKWLVDGIDWERV